MKKQLIGTFLAAHGESIFAPDDRQYDDMTLPHHLMPMPLVDGDRVEVRFSPRDNKVTGIHLLKRDREVVGIANRQGQVEPLHEIGVDRIVVSEAARLAGETVLVRLTTPRKPASTVFGKVIDRLSHYADARLESEIVLRTFNIPTIWEKRVLAEAQRSAAEKSMADECKTREDLRDCCFVTIDGEDAKDFDDAIHCAKTDSGWRISVAIADVASYVAAGSALDQAALDRGNSVYFPSYVVPMLPAVLSDEVCSLRPQKDKLALVCHLNLSSKGDIVRYKFSRGVIRSRARLTYSQVDQFFNDDKLSHHRAAGITVEIARMLRASYQAYQVLLQRRDERGTLDIDTLETIFLFDKTGKVRAIIPAVRNSAHRLIEEFMICANVCAARFLTARKKNLVYRVHTGLKQDSISRLKSFLNKCGIHFGRDSKGLAEVLKRAKDCDDGHLIQSVVLHSLTRAIYQPENIGHYGLALEEYTHFTSPIRRYPDLLVHRAIHSVLDSTAGVEYGEKGLEGMGAHCSMTEKRADDAAHDVEKYLKCVYAERHIGKTFSGVVTSATSFGLFVALDNIYVEGLLHVTNLSSDFYALDAVNFSLVGERTGTTYRQGDKIKVILAQIDAELRRIDLVLPETRDRRRLRRRVGDAVNK